MSLLLPDAVATYFGISNGGDISGVAYCFRADATVTDENRTHQGTDAIAAWQRKAQQAFAYRVEPLAATREGERLTVKARVVGDFPGSPTELDHAFVLQDGRIRSLEIS